MENYFMEKVDHLQVNSIRYNMTISRLVLSQMSIFTYTEYETSTLHKFFLV